ncbi:MAG: O-antigen ligase family protein [Actinomycetota bacterium]
MTLALPAAQSATLAPSYRRVVTAAQAGLFEQVMVVLTTFVFLHQDPTDWFRSRSDLLEASNPLIVAVELALIAVAFARVAGSIDLLISMIRLEPLIYVFSGLTFASLFWSADPAETFNAAVAFIAVTAYGSYLVMRFALDQIIRLLAIMFVLSAVLNLAFVLAFPEFAIDRGGNLTGVFAQKNALGFVAVVGIPTLMIASRSHRTGRILYVPAIGILTYLLWGSESKTMLLATAGPACLMFVYHLFRGRRTLRGAVIMSMAGSGIFAAAFATANIALLAQWLDKDVTLTGRVPMWQQLYPIFTERWPIGYGYGAAFGGYFSPVHELWIQSRWNPSHAHNALLHIALEVGVLGAIIFLVLYLRTVSRAIKIVAVVPGAVGLWPLTFLTTVLLISITESGVTSNTLAWMMMVVAVLSVGFHLRYRRDIGLTDDQPLGPGSALPAGVGAFTGHPDGNDTIDLLADGQSPTELVPTPTS